VTETIGLTRWTHASGLADTRRFRWFRVLTSATETLMAESDCPNYGIATLLVDAFALAELGDGAAPVDLLSEVCREIAAHPHLAVTSQEVPFCLLGQLLLASVDRLEDAAIEGLCAELEERHRRHDEWWEDEYGEAADLPRSHAFLWGITYFDQLHPVWLDLVEARFPTEPPAAAALRRRL
ncbi:MAG: hypothetical protein KDK70_44580, partial [Myxococcales bacterium]|nr:hypothetical protein [Myxococcales bacterium]